MLRGGITVLPRRGITDRLRRGSNSGKSGMAILKAIISGETDPIVLSELAEGRARNKLQEMRRSLQGRVLEHQQKNVRTSACAYGKSYFFNLRFR